MPIDQSDETIECTSNEGVVIGLIDSIIASANALRGSERWCDMTHPKVQEALADLRQSENVQRLFGQTFGPGYTRMLANHNVQKLEQLMEPVDVRSK